MSERLSFSRGRESGPTNRVQAHFTGGFLVALLWCAFSTVVAQEAPAGNGALELEADSVHYDKNTGNSLYRGNVVVTRKGLRLTGDEVEVFSRDGEYRRIVARARPATFRNRLARDEVKAEADVIEYDLKRRIIVFRGRARVDDGEKVLRGEHVVYDLDKKIVNATKRNGRVRLTIEPEP